VADSSTAVNYGQGDLRVTYSRGYSRINLVSDGGFEGYRCPDPSITFCFAESYADWIGTSLTGGSLDATIFSYAPYARSGKGSGLLGAAGGADALPGTLSSIKPLKTIPGKTYLVYFFHNSAYSGPVGEREAFVQVIWNEGVVATIRPGYSSWVYYGFTVTARGNDRLAFRGGKAPAWSFIDDVTVLTL